MSIENLIGECRKLYRQNNYAEALNVSNEILNADLNNKTALAYKARCLDLLGECEEALMIINYALTVYPHNTNYLNIKADVLMGMEEYDKAIGCYEEIFEIAVDDEVALDFLKSNYKTCLGLRIDQLIEMEKYVGAWECYCKKLKTESQDFDRLSAIESFKKYVRQYSSKVKSRHYFVRISCEEAKLKLLEFLEENGFSCSDDSGLLFSADVVGKTFSSVSPDEVKNNMVISESKFYDKVNYYPRGMIERKRIHDESGNLVYEGYTLDNAPYGFGTAYFENGSIYREGIFDIKGIVQGKEYYPSGRLRFEGQWVLTGGYGPNAPYNGNAYDEDGKLIYSGKFEIKRGGVGWPMILNPKGFPLEQKNRPKIEYL